MLSLCCPPLSFIVFHTDVVCLSNMLTVCFLSWQAPSSLLEALEQHLASLEGKKVKDSTAASRFVNLSIKIFNLNHVSEFLLSSSSHLFPSFLLEHVNHYICAASSDNLCLSCRASTLSNAVSSLASTGMSFTKVDEREKQAALEEEQARLKALKVPFS